MSIRFVNKGVRRGVLVPSLEGASAVLLGTNVSPANRTGTFNTQLDGASAALQGLATHSPNRNGSIATTLDGASGNLQGSNSGLPVPNLLSRSLPTFSSSGTAANAVSSNYNSIFQSSGSSVTIAQDISGVPASRKVSNALYLFMEAAIPRNSLYFDVAHRTGGGGLQTNLPTSYTIEGNSAAGGGSPPTSGWTTLGTFSNGYTSRKHPFSLAGLNWYRLNVSGSTGSTIQLKMDLYDISAGSRDILQVADSRGWFGLCHNDPCDRSVACDSLTNLMQPTAKFYAPTINVGMSGAKAGDINNLIAQWLTDLPGLRVATVNLGVNDATATPWSSGWTTSYQQLVNKLISAGLKVFCETIGDSTSSFVHGNLAAYNNAIASVVLGTQGAFNGFDEYTFFVNNPSYISGDGLHATDAGFAALRTAKAAFYAGLI